MYAPNLNSDLRAIANPAFIAMNMPPAIASCFNILSFISSSFSLLPLANADMSSTVFKPINPSKVILKNSTKLPRIDLALAPIFLRGADNADCILLSTTCSLPSLSACSASCLSLALSFASLIFSNLSETSIPSDITFKLCCKAIIDVFICIKLLSVEELTACIFLLLVAKFNSNLVILSIKGFVLLLTNLFTFT